MKKILVVDDDPVIVEGLMTLLQDEAYETAAAFDRESAEELIAAEFYPLVLADLRLRSNEEGLHLLDSIARISPGSRVAAMTGYATPELERELIARGASIVLRKPFEAAQIVAALRDMLVEIETLAARGEDLEELYRASRPLLAGIACKKYGLDADDAEELIQETWCLFLERKKEIRLPRAWLAGTIVNLCRQSIQKRIRMRARSPEPIERAYESDADLKLFVAEAMSRADSRSRRLCEMIAVEQLSYAEVSASLGIPLGSVGPLYIRAKQRLQNLILSNGNDGHASRTAAGR